METWCLPDVDIAGPLHVVCPVGLYGRTALPSSVSGRPPMFAYNVEITRLLKTGRDGTSKTELWAKIIEMATGMEMNQRIFWEDDEGILHDETPLLPIHLRELVDNAWIEYRRKG
jgi:hypothetical protein